MKIEPNTQELIDFYNRNKHNLPFEWEKDSEMVEATKTLKSEFEALTKATHKDYYIQSRDKAKEGLIAFRIAFERLNNI